MTKEVQKAIDFIHAYMHPTSDSEYEQRKRKYRDMAIKALEQEPCPYYDYELKTCRHANIGALATVTPIRPKGEWEEYGRNLGDDYIPIGIRCSNCHEEPPKKDPHKEKSFMNYIKSDFCPKCGADMRGEQG